MPKAMKPIDRLSDDEFAHLAQRAAGLPDAPAALVHAAIELFSARECAPLNELAAATLRLVRAVLSFDSWAAPQVAMGMRSLASDTRHLMFSAMGRDIDLRISPAANAFALSGQIFGPDDTGVVELITQSDGAPDSVAARVAPVGVFGDFRLDGVPDGTYRLTLRLGGDAIVLPAIHVGARRP
jgi:hypothetical protein